MNRLLLVCNVVLALFLAIRLADPGTVLVDSMTAAALEEDDRFVLHPRPAEDVRGFGEIHPVELRRGSGHGLVLD